MCIRDSSYSAIYIHNKTKAQRGRVLESKIGGLQPESRGGSCARFRFQIWGNRNKPLSSRNTFLSIPGSWNVIWILAFRLLLWQDRCRAALDELLGSSHGQAFIVLQRALCEHYPWIVDRMNQGTGCTDDDGDDVDSSVIHVVTPRTSLTSHGPKNNLLFRPR